MGMLGLGKPLSKDPVIKPNPIPTTKSVTTSNPNAPPGSLSTKDRTARTALIAALRRKIRPVFKQFF